MKLNDLTKNLEAIRDKGFIPGLRKGPTGIGHLLESELGLQETNIAIPDVGGRVELKATRRNANSLISLFTFNRAVWQIKQRDLIDTYGYIDPDGRPALYNSVVTHNPNAQGFYLEIDKQRMLILLRNTRSTDVIAQWSTFVIAGKFMTKLDRLLLVFADNKVIDNTEHFHFNEAHLLEQPDAHLFLDAFDHQHLIIDLRMHLRPAGGVRNHGTGFRLSEKHLNTLYAKSKRII